MNLWVRALEVWLTAKLLQSPAFHRSVHQLQRKVRQMTHGKSPEEMGGTNIDKINDPNARSFFGHFADEIKEQLRGGPPTKNK